MEQEDFELAAVAAGYAGIGSVEDASRNVPRKAAHLVLSMAPLQSGGDATSCSSMDSTSRRLPSDSNCVGGVASVIASIRNLPKNEESLFIPWLDRESVFVQMHPARLAVNKMVLSDYFQSRAFISTHSLLTLEDNTSNSTIVNNDDKNALSGLRTHQMPFLMSNTMIPPSNPWKEFTSMVHFDEPTGLAVIYIEFEIKTLGAPIVESTIGALNYIKATNSRRCGGGNQCFVPVVLFSIRDPLKWQPFIEAVTNADNPPAVILANQFSKNDDFLVPQKIASTWVVQFPSRDQDLSHSFRIEYESTDGDTNNNVPVVTNVAVTATNLEEFPLTLTGNALTKYQADQEFLKGLTEEAIQNDPVVGQSEEMPLTREGLFRRCMGGECPIGNLWTDAIRWGAGNVDVAFAPSGGLRGPGWEEGDVRVSDIYRAMPFVNTLCTGVMSGVSLFQFLNHSTSLAAFDSTYSKDGDNLMQISGARYTYNTNLNVSRLVSIDVWDREMEKYLPLERLKLYSFAVESFLCDVFQPYATMMGTGLRIEGEVAAVHDDSRSIKQVVSDFLREFHSVKPYNTSVQGRLVNDTSATETMDLIQTKAGCVSGTYWQEHIQTCSTCPSERLVSFDQDLIETDAAVGTVSQVEEPIFAINSDVDDVRLIISSLPAWVELSLSSSPSTQIRRGQPIDIPAGQQVGLQVTTSAENLLVDSLGYVQFSVVDDRYPGCFAEHDLKFEVLAHVNPPEEMNHLGQIRAGGLTLMAIVMLTAILFATWTCQNRKKRVIRASQPLFLILLCAGAIIMSSAIVPLSIDDSIASLQGCNIACMATPWLGSIGFTVVFSALFSKLHRVHKLLKNAENFRKVKISEKDVLKPFLVLLTLNFTSLLVWTVVDPWVWVRVPINPDIPWSTYGTCQSEDDGLVSKIFGALTLVINLAALLFACVQAYQARNIATEYAESKYIGIAIFGLFQLCIVGLPLTFLVRGNSKALYFLISGLIFTICMSVLLLMFVPKIQQQTKKGDIFAKIKRFFLQLGNENTESNAEVDDTRKSSSNGSFNQQIHTSIYRSSVAERPRNPERSRNYERSSRFEGIRILSMPDSGNKLKQELQESREQVRVLKSLLRQADERERKFAETMKTSTDSSNSNFDEEEGRKFDEEEGRKFANEDSDDRSKSARSNKSDDSSKPRQVVSAITFAGIHNQSN